MFKTLLLTVAALFAINASALTKIVLTPHNTVALTTAFTSSSVSQALYEVTKLDAKLEDGEPIYLFLNTPGGDVVDGLFFIQGLKAFDRPIHTITNFAASMGWLTVQNLPGKRYITQFGVLMAHRASGGVRGQISGEANERLRFWTSYTNYAMKSAAARLDITLEELHLKQVNEWWVHGGEAIEAKLADEIVEVKCSSRLLRSYKTVKIQTMFGTIRMKMNACPLLTAPISSSITKTESYYNLSNRTEVDKMFNQIAVGNHAGLLNDFILTGKFNSYVK